MMKRVFFVVTLLGLILKVQSDPQPCVCLLTYSQEAIKLVFNSLKEILEDEISNGKVSTSYSGIKLNAEQIQINSAKINEIAAKLLPNFGIEVSIIADVFVSYNVYNKVNSLNVLANVTSIMEIKQDYSGNPRLDMKDCDTVLKNTGTSEEAEGLEILEDAVTLALNQKLCLISSNILLGVNVQLGKFTDLNNLGGYLQIRYSLSSLPTVTKQQVDLSVDVNYYLLGKHIDVPEPNECMFLPDETITPVPMYSLQLHQSTFNAIFTAMEWAGAFKLDVSGQMVNGVNTLTTETLKPASPGISELYPGPNPVVLKLGVSKVPLVTLQNGMISLHLQPSLEIMVLPEFRQEDSLIVLSTDVQMKVNIKVDNYNLKTRSVELTRNITFSLESSAVGSVNMDILQKIIYPFVEKDILFHYKGALGVGWKLPSLLHLQLTDTNIDVHEGYAVVSGNLQLHD